MKILIAIITVLMCAVQAFAYTTSSITFGIASTARTSTPNLRIGVMKGPLGKDGNIPVQGMTLPAPQMFYLTKSTTFPFAAGTTAIEIQTDQDTKLYVGSDLTNYLLIYAGTPVTYIVK